MEEEAETSSQNDPSGPAGQAVIHIQLEEQTTTHTYLQSSDLEMNGKAGGRAVSTTTDLNSNSNSGTAMVSELPPESQPYTRASRTPRKAAMFGKRSNSMRRNPKAEVAKQGWLYKQASSGVKQWNKRWFVLTDRCLFYYKDEKEDTVLGSLPLLSFRIGGLQPADNVTRKFTFKAEHAGTRTYYFSAESLEEQEEWVTAMTEAAQVRTNPQPPTPTGEHNNSMVTKGPEHPAQQATPHPHLPEDDSLPASSPEVNGGLESPPPSTPRSDQEGRTTGGSGERGERPGLRPAAGPGPGPGHPPGQPHQPNGWAHYGPHHGHHHGNNAPPPGGHGNGRVPQGHPEGREPAENVVLRRGFVPRTAPERQAQRKSSMTQLQQWVNQRRGMAAEEDLNSPSRYYSVSRGGPGDYYAVYGGGPPYLEEYPMYPPGVRPDSVCSVSAVAFDRRRSLRDGGPPPPSLLYGAPPPRESWGGAPPGYYGGVDPASMRRLSIQPRSRSVPRSPSSSSGGPYSPGPLAYASPGRSPSGRLERGPPRMREDVIYADPSVYGLRRSISSPKYDYPGDRRSLSQGMYHNYNYPASPSVHSKMEDMLDLQLQRNLEYLDQQVPPFHDVYRELHPTLKLNEVETSKLLGRLCEQTRLMKDQENVVLRLRMDKDSLEGALVTTHQEMELYRSQPLAMDKLQLKKETLQNQLINIRGQLSQASSALTTTRMECEALEDEANAIHGDLWEQLNAGGQSELVHRHIQKEFWRVQDVLEGLHKSNPSRGTNTAKHRVAGGQSGSFSTNSPASPMSSISLTSPLSPFSPVPGSQGSPTKQLGAEVSTGPPSHPARTHHLGPELRTHRDVHRRSRPSSSGPNSNSHSYHVDVDLSNCRAGSLPQSCLVPDANPPIDAALSPSTRRDTQSSEMAPIEIKVEYYTLPCSLQAHFETLPEQTDNSDPNPDLSNYPGPDPTLSLVKASAGDQNSLLQLQDQNPARNSTHSTKHNQRWPADSNQTQQGACFTNRLGCQQPPPSALGGRKDVYPDPHPPTIPLSHQPFRGDASFHRHVSVPESGQSLQRASPVSQLARSYSPDVPTHFMPHTGHRPTWPEIEIYNNGNIGMSHAHVKPCGRSRPRPLTYPNNQLARSSADPTSYQVKVSHSPKYPAEKVFKQTHL